MKNHGNNTPAMTFPEMVADGAEQKTKSKLYKVEASQFVDERLAALIAKTTDELTTAATAEPVTLTDTEEVKRRTVYYLRACETSSSFPSIAGLARSMGLSRQAVYDCIWRHSPAKTADWLELCRDSFSDILAEASLRNDCNNITAIFLQKALYGLRESVEIVARQENPLGPVVDKEELVRRIAADYADLPED